MICEYWRTNRGRLLLRTPGPVPFGTCICSYVETILSWTCHIYGPFELRTSLGTSILLANAIRSCNLPLVMLLKGIEERWLWKLYYIQRHISPFRILDGIDNICSEISGKLQKPHLLRIFFSRTTYCIIQKWYNSIKILDLDINKYISQM